MISQHLTFRYEFAVEDFSGMAPQEIIWTGQGSGQAHYGESQGLVGSKPRFNWRTGWLHLLPSEGWTPTFPIRWFSDFDTLRIGDLSAQWSEAHEESLKEAASRSVKGDFLAYARAKSEALQAALRRRGLTREVASFSVFVGDALGRTLRIGDTFKFSRDANADFRYSVVRNSETILSAGSVSLVDEGGAFAVWQEYERQPNPYAEAARKKLPNLPVAEWIDVHKPYVSARVENQRFLLLDGQQAYVDPYYVFLARSNQKVPTIAFEFTPRAVHAAGFLGALSREWIIEAARQLMAPVIRML